MTERVERKKQWERKTIQEIVRQLRKNGHGNGRVLSHLSVCVGGVVTQWVQRKEKKPKDSLRVNLYTIVVVFVIIVNIVVVVFLLIQDNF